MLKHGTRKKKVTQRMERDARRVTTRIPERTGELWGGSGSLESYDSEEEIPVDFWHIEKNKKLTATQQIEEEKTHGERTVNISLSQPISSHLIVTRSNQQNSSQVQVVTSGPKVQKLKKPATLNNASISTEERLERFWEVQASKACYGFISRFNIRFIRCNHAFDFLVHYINAQTVNNC